MNFDNKTVLVTGANRGIGKALVEALLKKNVKKVYACSRDIKNVPDFGDSRVVLIQLDISDSTQIQNATRNARDTQILINNAGVISPGGLFDCDLKRDMEINYFSTIQMMKAFVPVLEQNPEARIINIASIASYVNFPFIAGYSASKAALYSATQAARIELRSKGIAVHAVNPGAIDTDMNKGSTMDMTSPTEVAFSILNEVEKEVEDIIPDKIGRGMYEMWERSPKELEAFSRKMYEELTAGK
ncbi:SDR family oxidoreductase [Peredibacter starrii]|uniref:SDR family oxidoreductase n=1 Tax=Peredibacter starrii TaxID=28202 RepID=A0AAX4HUF7_9BACT|nr:SDR family oxidoreductase [Peredibacter starrii]WPU66616.1 SDR family oxidoreductase [Peredibacter starrii]